MVHKRLPMRTLLAAIVPYCLVMLPVQPRTKSQKKNRQVGSTRRFSGHRGDCEVRHNHGDDGVMSWRSVGGHALNQLLAALIGALGGLQHLIPVVLLGAMFTAGDGLWCQFKAHHFNHLAAGFDNAMLDNVCIHAKILNQQYMASQESMAKKNPPGKQVRRVYQRRCSLAGASQATNIISLCKLAAVAT